MHRWRSWLRYRLALTVACHSGGSGRLQPLEGAPRSYRFRRLGTRPISRSRSRLAKKIQRGRRRRPMDSPNQRPDDLREFCSCHLKDRAEAGERPTSPARTGRNIPLSWHEAAGSQRARRSRKWANISQRSAQDLLSHRNAPPHRDSRSDARLGGGQRHVRRLYVIRSRSSTIACRPTSTGNRSIKPVTRMTSTMHSSASKRDCRPNPNH